MSGECSEVTDEWGDTTEVDYVGGGRVEVTFVGTSPMSTDHPRSMVFDANGSLPALIAVLEAALARAEEGGD